MAHLGEQPRPAGQYFTIRHDLLAQGDIFRDVPFFLPPKRADEPWDLEAADAMILTRSCDIDSNRTSGLIQIAPIVNLGDSPINAGTAAAIRSTDCAHTVMYLPEEGGSPERLVQFYRAEPIDLELLTRCERETQLTYEATKWLLRKLVIANTGFHPDDLIEPPADDF